MVKNSKGLRRGTRSKLKKKYKENLVVKFAREFNIDDSVAIKIEPSSHRGMPHPRFQGHVGKVADKRGRAYVLHLNDGKIKKKLIVTPEHLKKIESGKK